MTHTVELDYAETQLSDLVQKASAGAEVIITRAGMPIAKLVAAGKESPDREPGSARGLFTVPDDFEAPLDELKDYM